ncbi:MFS transporter [Zooshikella harenae]|uniref:MFS transporter n=1 Tax=Zooshikella harenae TaxID=2827238 RepID=A0ABS5ZIB1_9GAMM|nr:MFS transporter [Zooshikella harenae]MBU2713816.1 MFS transporter [Zooshikella harenae]
MPMLEQRTAYTRVISSKWTSIGILILCEVFALTLWFSATAIVPILRSEYQLGDWQASLFSSGVAVGFVIGTLVSALLGLSDRFDPRRFFSVSALVAAACNGSILLVDPTSWWVIFCRFTTGICMAGLYPVGMKIAASWAEKDTGLLIGLLVGALTLGSASPHLFNAIGGIDWQLTIQVASVCALIAGGLIHFVGLGPQHSIASVFHWKMGLRAWQDKSLRLANLGYFGHMWELYAMWAWIGVFFHASFSKLNLVEDIARFYANTATFLVIAAGALGCLLGGLFADKLGRTTLTILAMLISGSCALLVGFLFGGNPWLLTALCIVWGVAIVADSAQFSSCIVELSEPAYRGTMLTVQTSVGFLLTLVTIHLLPLWVDYTSWHYAFAFLAIGPFLGVVAMWRLRLHPDAIKLAHGKR